MTSHAGPTQNGPALGWYILAPALCAMSCLMTDSGDLLAVGVVGKVTRTRHHHVDTSLHPTRYARRGLKCHWGVIAWAALPCPSHSLYFYLPILHPQATEITLSLLLPFLPSAIFTVPDCRPLETTTFRRRQRTVPFAIDLFLPTQPLGLDKRPYSAVPGRNWRLRQMVATSKSIRR